ncbi:MAG: hypothetical protein FD180_2666 [Planctomycetota bacterium]|nr:MAG: hypothetical protein FD180_2666 [Planctomycetota bacterium]
MKRTCQRTCISLAALFAAGCASASGARVTPAASAVRMKEMWEPLVALAGEWEMTGQDGKKMTACVIEVTSGGSIVRERLFPGTPNEMTNVYCMDGSDVVLTHYCHAGNQPHMRATSGAGGKFDFAFESVTLPAADAFYMGSMTLVISDKDHMEQAWNSVQGEKKTEPMVVLKAERKK